MTENNSTAPDSLSDRNETLAVVRTAVELPLEYRLSTPNVAGADDEREMIVLLHGFAESGEKILGEFLPVLPKDAVVLAANGPFPLPRRTSQGAWKVGYSWYFWNTREKSFAIDMQGAIALLLKAIAQSDPTRWLATDKARPETSTRLNVRVIGFSQGGWLAPVLADAICTSGLARVTQTVCIGCEYSLERSPPPFRYRIDGIHGDQDKTVSCETAASTFSLLKAAGLDGEFEVVAGAAHGLEPSILLSLKRALLRA